MTDPTALPNLPGFGGNPAPAGVTEPPAEAPLGERLADALRSLELEPTLDSDGDLSFQVEQQQLFIRFSEEDAQVLRLFGQWQLADPVPTDQVERLEACNDVNIAFNMIKTGLANDTLLVTSEHMLPRGEYRGELYDIGFDKPETHVIEKSGRLYYALYARNWNGTVNIRGLAAGRYRVRDYFNDRDLGEIRAPAARLSVAFEQFLVLEAVPV